MPGSGLKHSLAYLWVAIVVLLLGLGGTAAVTLQLKDTIEARDRDRFSNAANALHDDISSRLSAYIAMLQAGAGLFAAQPDLTREQFRAFVERLRLSTYYPGIQGIGFTRRVSPEDLSALIAAQQRAGFRSFRVWPEDPRDEYHSIVYLEPLDRRNLAAIGYDMYTEPVRRAAMEQARDGATTAASGPVTLVQEIEGERQAGFLIYAPVYRGGTVPPTLEERRTLLAGFVYSPFRAGDLFTGIYGREAEPRVGFQLFDGTPEEGRLLHESHPDFRGRPRFSGDQQIPLAGRIWTARYFSTPGLEAGSSQDLVPLVSVTGIAVSVLLAFATALQGRARQRAELSEAALREQAKVLEVLNESERASRAEAERMSRLKDEFLATVSHELRTPLNAVIGWIHLLRDTRLPDDSREKALDTIERNARVQAQLIEDLLDMGRIASGQPKLDRRPVDVGEVVEGSVRMVQPPAIEKGLRMDVDVEPGLPRLSADHARLQQIAWNLLVNAIKFTPPGGHVSVTVRRTAEAIEMTVADTGVGVSPEFIPYMFDRFRQADASSTRRHGGLGLGLAIVKSLVEAHGGRVSAQSEGLNRGTTVTVALPLTLAVEGAGRTEHHEPYAGTGADFEALSGARVLVVDDDADAREVARALLAAHGADVVTADSAPDGLRLLANGQRLDLIVSDLGMPQMDGYEFLKHVRALPADRGGSVPALALTAFTRPDAQLRVFEAGYQAHIGKPVDPGHFIATCARLVTEGEEVTG